jgi:hypothetical protein
LIMLELLLVRRFCKKSGNPGTASWCNRIQTLRLHRA